jgi:hypothetical protein
MGQNHFDHMRVVDNAQLIGDGQQQRVGLGDKVLSMLHSAPLTFPRAR